MSGEYVYTSTGTEVSNGTSSNSVEEDYEQEAYLHAGHHAQADGQDYGEHSIVRNYFQVILDTLCYNILCILVYIMIYN